MTKNRSRPARGTSPDPKGPPSQRSLATSDKLKAMREPKGKATFRFWDGKKYVDISPEVLLKSAGIRLNERGTKKKLDDPEGRLESKERSSIERMLISTLKKVENEADRQSIFKNVAAGVGLQMPDAQTHIEEEATAVGATTPDTPPLPVRAEFSYRDRPDTRETAEQFLRRVYEPWIAVGSLFQFHIGKLDPPLLQGLKNQFKGRASELRALLPRKEDEVSQRLAALVGKEVDDPAQRRLLAQAERNMSAALGKLKM